MEVINIKEKYEKVKDLWTPHIITSLNGQDVKIAKVDGQFIWHDHQDEDELFLVIKGELHIEFRDGVKTIREGEMMTVPRGVEHRPYTDQECWILLFEPQSTLHTGDVESELTVHDQKRI